MSPKKLNKKKKLDLNNIQSLLTKNLDIEKLNINPTKIIEGTKNRIGNFYNNFKKEREKEKKRLEKKRKVDEKKELKNQKKQALKEKIDKIK